MLQNITSKNISAINTVTTSDFRLCDIVAAVRRITALRLPQENIEFDSSELTT
jgi:hypothetical protein